MSILKIEEAALNHLNSLSPTLPTSIEGREFDPPDTAYQIVQFSISPPDDPVLGTGYYRELIQLQIFVSTPSGLGQGEALARAELLRNHFKKSTTLTNSGILIHVLKTPQIAGSSVVGERVIVPVLIDLVSEIYTA